MQQAFFSAPVVCLLGETKCFVLRFPERPLSGLAGEADHPTFRFLLLTIVSFATQSAASQGYPTHQHLVTEMFLQDLK